MDQTGQSLQQFSSRHQECTACLFEATQIVAQSGASCSPSSLATLIQHLEPALPDKTSSVQQPDRRYTDSSNNGTWKNTLGVTQLGNYLTLSSLTPNVASLQSSVSDVPADTLDGTRKGKEKQRSASTSWAPSWDTLTKPFHISGMSTKYSTSDGAQKRCSVSLSQSYRAGQDDDSDSDESVAEHISSLAEKRAPQEDQLSEADTSSARIEDPARSSSAAIDNDAISEALSSELAIDCVESSEASLVSLAETLRFFDAEQNRWQLAYRFSVSPF